VLQFAAPFKAPEWLNPLSSVVSLFQQFIFPVPDARYLGYRRYYPQVLELSSPVIHSMINITRAELYESNPSFPGATLIASEFSGEFAEPMLSKRLA